MKRRERKALLLARFSLPPTATLSELREEYLDLLEIFEPARFEGDARIQGKVRQAAAETREDYEALLVIWDEEPC